MQQQPHWRRLLLRTEKSADEYEAYIAKRGPDSECPLCHVGVIIREFEYWLQVENKFPYDRYFEKSDMLITKRHVAEGQLSYEERHELHKLKQNVLYTDYDSLIEHFPAQKSIPGHVHFHLVTYKRPDGEPR